MNRTTRTLACLLLGLAACGDDDGFPDGGRDTGMDVGDIDGGGMDGGDGGGGVDSAIDGGTGRGSFVVHIENIGEPRPFTQSGAFDTPDGADAPGPIGPGESYTVNFMAAPGMRLSFATMFVPSNDYFYAPGGMGIALFDEEGNSLAETDPLNVSDQLMLWDAGTEIDQPVGEGADQVQRQEDPNTGADDPDETVRLVPEEITVPDTTDIIRAVLTSEVVERVHQFTLTITNMSTPLTLTTIPPQAVPLSPGVFVVHTGDNPLFTSGTVDRGEGLEGLAEDGMPGALAVSAAAQTGPTIVSSPGAYLVSTEGEAFFTDGEMDRGEGLEAIAEDGKPLALAGAIPGAMAVNTPLGAPMPGPLAPGESYEFTIVAERGDRLHLVTMFVPSNDWFFSLTGDQGLALFDDDGVPVDGDVSNMLLVYDLGTEVDQPIGFGLDQVDNQPDDDTGGTDTNTTIRRIYPDDVPFPLDTIRVTVSPGA